MIIKETKNWRPELDAKEETDSPDMLEALRAIYEINVPDKEWSETLETCFRIALAAITKAEGETT